MKFKQTMSALKKMGTAQNRKVYARHGAGENMFGVSFANLNQLKKEIGTDQDLAEQLWRSGNVDAMSLATMIADPEAFTAKQADDWLAACDYSVNIGLFAGVIACSPLVARKVSKWTRSRKELTLIAGYDLLCGLLRHSADAIDDDKLLGYLDQIESKIHQSPNYARHSMNAAVTAIGISKPSLRKQAIATAKRIGKVEVDHGETNCKTPDAVAYIQKAAAREKTTGRKTKARASC